MQRQARFEGEGLVGAEHLDGPLQQRLQHPFRAVPERLVGAANPLHQAKLPRFSGRQAPRLEQQRQAAGRPQQGEQVDAAAPGRGHVQLGLQEADFGLGRGDAQVAGHGKLRTAAERVAVEGGEHGHRKAADRIQRCAAGATSPAYRQRSARRPVP